MEGPNMSRDPDPASHPVSAGDPDATGSAGAAAGTTGSGLGQRLHKLERQATAGAAEGARTASALGKAAEAMRLEVISTGLRGDRVLVGHVLGTHLVMPAGGLHGPRQTPAVVYLFADALAVRPSDDAPMSTVPLFGLHMLFPPVAVTRWLYKAGRIEHANLDLVSVAREFEAAIVDWTVDDFADADPKLQVHRFDSVVGPVHVYDRLDFAHLWVPVSTGHPVHLKSTLPAPAEAFTALWEMFHAMNWPAGISMDAPPGGGGEPAQ
jgi:hypothetical protein